MVVSGLLGLALAWLALPAGVMQTSRLLEVARQPGLEGFARGTGRCPVDARHCVGLSLHVVVDDGEPVQSPRWFHGHVAGANRLFAPIGVGFEVVDVQPHDASFAHVQTRRDRDRLGDELGDTRGVVHVFIVRRLADVDIDGEVIRGVHWRYRPQTTRRWIIVSSIASSMVLAHELGHFFGLPHTRDQRSIMNKEVGKIAWSKRGFVARELATMRRSTARMVKDGTLRPQRQNPETATPRME